MIRLTFLKYFLILSLSAFFIISEYPLSGQVPYKGNWYFYDSECNLYSEMYVSDSTIVIYNDVIELFGAFRIKMEAQNLLLYDWENKKTPYYITDNYPESPDTANFIFGGDNFMLIRLDENILTYKLEMRKKEFKNFKSNFMDRRNDSMKYVKNHSMTK
jgi:hypothetical protein